MIDNARRQVLLVALVLATAIALISTMWPPPLGLDLSGGSRLIYFVDIEAAKENEQVPDDADPEQIMLQTVASSNIGGFYGRQFSFDGQPFASIVQN